MIPTIITDTNYDIPDNSTNGIIVIHYNFINKKFQTQKALLL